jgi:hypothetical protein
MSANASPPAALAADSPTEKDTKIQVTETSPPSTPPIGKHVSAVVSLSKEDLTRVREEVGAPPLTSEDIIPKKLSSSLLFSWPPNELPKGLYREVVTSRCKAQYQYYFTAALYNTCLVLQLILGAALTALGSSSAKNGIAITILAAANTVNAGIVALLHNSGLPTRIRNSWSEFDKVEAFIMELIYTGIVPAGTTKEEIVDLSFSKYKDAKATVLSNMPTVWTTGPTTSTTKP